MGRLLGFLAVALVVLLSGPVLLGLAQRVSRPRAGNTTAPSRRPTVPADTRPSLLFPVIFQQFVTGSGKKYNGVAKGYLNLDAQMKPDIAAISTWATVKVEVLSVPSYLPDALRKFVCETFLDSVKSKSTVVPTMMYMTYLQYSQTASAARWYMLKTLSEIVVTPTFLWLSDNIDMADSTVMLQDSNFLSISASLRDEARAIIDLLVKYSWTTFSIVATETSGKAQFINAIHEVQQSSEENELTLCDIVHMPAGVDEKTAADRLSMLVKSDTRIYVLHATHEDAGVIMRAASSLKLTGEEHLWIANHAVMEYLHNDALNTASKFPHGMLGITFDQTDETIKEVLRNAMIIWLNASASVLHSCIQNGSISLEALNEYTVSAVRRVCSNDTDSEPFPVEQYNMLQNFSFQLAEWYRNEFNSSALREKLVNFTIYNYQENGWRPIGNWYPAKRIQISDIAWPGQSINPPTGKPKKYRLKVITLREDPFVIYSQMIGGKCQRNSWKCTTRNPNGTVTQCCSGFCIDLLVMLSEDLRFDFDLEEVADGKWGGLNKTTSEWNGLVRALIDHQADTVMTSLKITPDRSSVVEFSVPYLETGIRIIVAMSSGKISATAFLEPYDAVAWCLILLVSVHISAALIFIFENIINYYGKGKRHVSCDGDGPKEEGYSLCRVTWLIWSLLFGASCRSDNPHGLSSRVLTYVYALFSLVFLASYTANLAAFMITKDTWHDISGIRDPGLMSLRFGTIPSGATEETIRKNFPSMYKHMSPYGRNNVDDGIEAVKNDSLDAFAYDARVLEYKAANDPRCRLQTVGKMYAMTGYGVAFPKNSHWRAKFSERILEYQDNGKLERLEKIWMTGACSQKDAGDSSNVLHIKNFASAFILVGAATGISLVLLCCEHIYFRFFRPFVKRFVSINCCFLLSEAMGKSFLDGTDEETKRREEFAAAEAMFEQATKCGKPEDICKLRKELLSAKKEAERLKSLLKDHGIEFTEPIPSETRDAEQNGTQANGEECVAKEGCKELTYLPHKALQNISTEQLTVTNEQFARLAADQKAAEHHCTCTLHRDDYAKAFSVLPPCTDSFMPLTGAMHLSASEKLHGSQICEKPSETDDVTINKTAERQHGSEFPVELYDNRPEWAGGSHFNEKLRPVSQRIRRYDIKTPGDQNLSISSAGNESLYSMPHGTVDQSSWKSGNANNSQLQAAIANDDTTWTLRNPEGDARDRRIRAEIEKVSSSSIR